MDTSRPELNDEDIGMRAFQVRKAKAVERAMDRLRQGLKHHWGMLTRKDLDDLSWIFGELWAFEKRADWEELHFSALTPEDVQAILAMARTLREAPRDTVETLERVGDVIRARSV